MVERLQLGISTCPNDTFAFHGLLSGAIRVPGLELSIELHDVEELNEGLFEGRYDLAKGSFFAALQLSAELVVLRTGAALGFGNGPLLLTARGELESGLIAPENRVLAPGEWTTATLLYRLFHSGEGQLEQRLFSDIMPALERGEADFGICIHEGRFTYAGRGLRQVEDLGATWEAETGAPLPLGGIFARRRLGAERIAAVEAALAASIEYARAHPSEALVSMRRYAAEQTDEVLLAHVELYVNESTRRLGDEGRAALVALERRARAKGLVGAEHPPLEVFGG